ncbi:hypothetical protein Dsin_014192 [Dipteronia sinensis]|uniref:Ankyrin repeat protein n=1 Tax=Dipteronia sinensis TaxID=43782 RepID=A0AAE0EA33_9ROSI|nr:hypothetical protein Dsin_014192 [Dipteronia sinensis]
MPNSISEEPINRLPSNLGGSAHQSQLFYMPNSSSEEPIHPLPSNLGGSAHQPDQLSEPESEPEICVQSNVNPVLQANHESEGVQPNVNPSLQPNHESGGVQQNVNLSLIPNRESGGVQPNVNPSLQPINRLPSNLGGSAHQSQLFMPNSSSEEPNWEVAYQPDQLSRSDRTAEHLNYYRSLFNAAQRGDWKTAKSFIDNDPDALTVEISIELGTVLHIAALHCQWNFVLRLLELDVSTPQSIAVRNSFRSTVLHYVADGGSLKAAKALVEKNANLLQMVNNDGCLPLVYSIDTKSKELVWYLSFKTRVESPSSPFFIPELLKILRTLIRSGYHDTVLGWFKRLLWKAITQLVPSIKIVRDAKMTHECAIQLVNHVVNELSLMSFSQICHFLLNPISILDIAIEEGIEEIVRTLLRHFPDLTFLGIRPERNILQAAIECRQEKIVNIINEISPSTTIALCSQLGENDNTTLHLAGKLAPAFKLFSVSGAALQMQRELQWFKVLSMSN